ncbi:xylulokinase [Dactylosporangium matsuzakiense]|uniref:Xylulose kinase n=1 Tax=Dactylosporangium matsuzakiense TaxID=53360 RepID=A0A9W6KJI1_9ACTN|nr:xylulokinase [Dactylosporangium matsuzakiense]UWZ46591.1 xylulokinase [Dactylosporangium matsuzakiense]GLL01280.1 xylulokinase [Dactylosporangium matsuzakiense]
MTLVAGVDTSTQSTKVVVCDADTGAVVREGRAGHPDGTEVAPAHWWTAFQEATAGGLLDGVAAIGVGGQQHGMVLLDEAGEVVRDALLWNDTRSAGAAEDLIAELPGGAAGWAEAVGLVPVASFTVTKLRWVARHEPAVADRAASVMLPHDWITHRLRADGGEPTTDRGDASGTGYWSAATGSYRTDLVRLAFGRDLALPRVAGPAEVVGETAAGALLAAGTGDNMAAALGLGLRPGDLVVSLGTSGTVFGVSAAPVADPSGTVAGFADATGHHLPLVATMNAARVLTAVAGLLGVSLSALAELALAAQPGAGGLTLLPYLDGERTPNLPDARGLLNGLTRGNATPQNLARAAYEGMLCGLADGLDAVRGLGVQVQRVLLIGGAAASPAVRSIAAGLLGVPVSVPSPGEYVALGAARQAAWALSGAAEAPDWQVSAVDATATAESGVRKVYADVRDRAQPLLR